MDIKFLVPTILSIISICFTIIGIKRLSLFQNWQVYFEENKEKIRQQEKITDNIFNKLNSRAGLIPYFNIILDDSKIKENDGKIYLGISLINIGKESATNVGICLTEERKEIIVEGYDKNRVEILSAVLSRSLKVDVNSKDIYINIPGGIDLNDRSSDLAVVFSLLSSIKGIPVSQKIAAIGELGLRGEVRKVSFIKNRVNELEKLGFVGVYLPKSHQADFEKEKIKTKIKLNYISNISELVERIR